MEDSGDDDGIYGQEDVFDPEVHDRLLQELSQPVHTYHPPRSAFILRLGINVTRGLISYLAIEDMVRFTSSCRWLYRFGNDPDVLSRYGRLSDEGIGDPEWTLRRAFIDKHRMKVLETKAVNSLRRDLIFDPELTDLFHVESLTFHLVFFSVSQSRVIIWKYFASKCTVLLSFPGTPEVVSYVIHRDGILLLGDCSLVVTWTHWSTFQKEDKSTHSYLFPYSQHTAFLRFIEHDRLVATLRLTKLTIFSAELNPLRELSFSLKMGLWTSVEAVCVPSPTSPYLVTVYSCEYHILDTTNLENRLRKPLPFRYLTQVDCMTVANADKERCWLLCLGIVGMGSRLYCNGTFQLANVHSFQISHDKIVCYCHANRIVILQAHIDAIQQIRELLFSSLPFSHFYANCSMMLGVGSSSEYDSKLCKAVLSSEITYINYQGAKVHTEKIRELTMWKTFNFRSSLVTTGVYKDQKCIAIVYYYRDADSTQTKTEADFYQQYTARLARCIERESEKDKQARLLLQRSQRKEEQSARKALKLRMKSKMWKRKIEKYRRIDVRLMMLGEY